MPALRRLHDKAKKAAKAAQSAEFVESLDSEEREVKSDQPGEVDVLPVVKPVKTASIVKDEAKPVIKKKVRLIMKKQSPVKGASKIVAKGKAVIIQHSDVELDDDVDSEVKKLSY